MGTRSVNNSGNGDGDSKIAGQTCPNLASDGVVASPPILTPNPGMASSYANVTGKSSRTKVNFYNLFTPACNAIDVVVPMRFGVNHKMTKAVPAPPTDPPCQGTDPADGGSVDRTDQLSGTTFEFQKQSHGAIEKNRRILSYTSSRNLKVHEVVMEKDSKIYKGKKEIVKSITLKAKKESSDDETLTSGSDDEEYATSVRNVKKFFRRKGKFVRQPREEKKSFRQRDEKKEKSDRKCFRCGDPNHLIGDCPKPSRNKDQKAFIRGSWSDSENDAEDKTNDETCLMAQSSNEVTLNSFYYSDNASSLDNETMQIEYDSLCEISLEIINKNKILKTKRDLLEKEILELNKKIKKLERSKEIDITCKLCQELNL
ncbi:zf-CCHC domain-containing protein [Tanacetum coccineum]|uniref:Zf-CCHC domain-containing protein n=1 Tax=Tanacetum coccineum TaxID=301880 RepID=A0ABQ5APE9_9ASTR